MVYPLLLMMSVVFLVTSCDATPEGNRMDTAMRPNSESPTIATRDSAAVRAMTPVQTRATSGFFPKPETFESPPIIYPQNGAMQITTNSRSPGMQLEAYNLDVPDSEDATTTEDTNLVQTASTGGADWLTVGLPVIAAVILFLVAIGLIVRHQLRKNKKCRQYSKAAATDEEFRMKTVASGTDYVDAQGIMHPVELIVQ